MPELNQAFLDLLRSTPQLLADFVKAIGRAYDHYQSVPAPGPAPAGPNVWKAGETHPLTTVGLSREELDALAEGKAEGAVVEKGLAAIKAFVSGVLMVAA